MVKKLYLSIGLGAAVFLAFSVYLDVGLILKTLGRFDLFAGLIALGLAALNYLARFCRWQLYLQQLEIPIPPLISFRIFLSGLALSVTPGKAGELVKAYLIKKSVGSPMGQGASAVFTERLTDFVALLILSLVGIFSTEEDILILVIVAGGIAAIFFVIFLPGVIPLLLTILGRIPIASRAVGLVQDAYVSARRLLSPVLLLQGLLLGVVAWFAECAGFFFVLRGFGAAVSLSAATFIYAFATIFGALTLLPGGIGTTEGSMTGLLAMQGLPILDAVAATFVIRVCTLWFAVAIGAMVLVKYAATHDVTDLDPAVNESTM